MNEKIINNKGYADDTLIFTESIDGFQNLLYEINQVTNEYGFEMNSQNTKYMLISNRPPTNSNISLNSETIEKVSE